MSKANLGWLYYKDMYKCGNDDGHIEKTFKKLFEVNTKDESLGMMKSFILNTTYPGLIIGSGYTHGISNDNDIKMGFYFDHTSGIPTLPGSSIKGVLRSMFGYSQNENYKEQKHKFIQSLLDKEVDVETLAKEIFEGVKDEKALSIYKRDKFYEARIIQTAGSILQSDYITPHKDPLKNPIPIRIIKVGAKTSFEFSFELHDTQINGITITADDKLKLFFQLLQFNGMGAKTNVGYGQFEDKSVEMFSTEIRMKQEALKEQEQKKAQELQEQIKQQELDKLLNSSDSNVDKIKIIIKDLSDNKQIHDEISKFTLSEEEKTTLVDIIEKQIGAKPQPKNKAKIRWAIKIYELLGR